MADEEQLRILKQGIEAWNVWRRQAGNTRTDLSGANLPGADLSEANMHTRISTRRTLRTLHPQGGTPPARRTSAGRTSCGRTSAERISARQTSAGRNSWERTSAERHPRADLVRAHLYKADLSKAKLNRAQLCRANLAEATS